MRDILLEKNYLFIYFWRAGKEGRKRGRETLMCERNIHQLPLKRTWLGTWPATQACDLTGNQTGNPSVHRLALNPLSHTSQSERHTFKPIS